MARDPASEQAAETESAAENRQFLTFELADERYGIDILDIREIIEYGNLTPVPMMPDFVAGVINLRGSVVPVVNLALRFGKKPKEIGKRTSIVIIDASGGESRTEIGVMVDLVNEVLDISAKDIAPAPAFGANIRTDFISGMGKVENGFLVLLDVTRVLSIDELSMLQQVGEAAEAQSQQDVQPEDQTCASN